MVNSKKMFPYILVGGGLASASAVEGIREIDQKGEILLLSKEPHLPYDRPPLTKGLWSGKTTLDQIPIHPDSFYQEKGVTLMKGSEVTMVDPREHAVRTMGGEEFYYQHLLLATGGRPRAMPFDGGHVQYFRTVDDFQTVLAATEGVEDFVVIGGGFIGAELAASLCGRRRRVTMMFPHEYVLQRILPEALAQTVTQYYREKGVQVMGGSTVAGIGRSGKRTTLSLKDGRRIETGMVIAALGIDPRFAPAKIQDLGGPAGIPVNQFLQTTAPDICAAGDVAIFPSAALERTLRIEHWDNARAQGKHAGRTMAGDAAPFLYLPYFWSDLFDLGWEAIGDVDARLETYAVWQEPQKEGVVYYLENQKVRGVLLWNHWDKVDAARELIEARESIRDKTDLDARL